MKSFGRLGAVLTVAVVAAGCGAVDAATNPAPEASTTTMAPTSRTTRATEEDQARAEAAQRAYDALPKPESSPLMEKARAIAAVINASPTGGGTVGYATGVILATVTDPDVYDKLVEKYGDDAEVEITFMDPERFAELRIPVSQTSEKGPEELPIGPSVVGEDAKPGYQEPVIDFDALPGRVRSVAEANTLKYQVVAYLRLHVSGDWGVGARNDTGEVVVDLSTEEQIKLIREEFGDTVTIHPGGFVWD